MIVKDFIRYDCPVARPQNTPAEALEMMHDYKISQIPYIDENDYLALLDELVVSEMESGEPLQKQIKPNYVNPYSIENQHIIEVKEIRMSPSIGLNDFNVKLRNGLKFLKEGNRLKVTVRFRGREMAHTDIGEKLLVKFADGCAELGTVDKNAKLEGRHMSMFLTPKAVKH